jgi:hypothetical protein
MDTDDEWQQCRACCFREGHYVGQRLAAARRERFDLLSATPFSEEAWDFRDYAK